MSEYTEKPSPVKVSSERETIGLIKKLLAAWGCGLLFGGGMLLGLVVILVPGIVAAATFGMVDYGPDPIMTGVAFVSLGMVLIASILVGLSLKRNWFWGIFGSGLAILAAGITGWVMYQQSDELMLFEGIPAVAASITIGTIVLTNEKAFSIRRVIGLLIGLVIGVSITIMSATLLGRSSLAVGSGFHLVWQIPPSVWVSAVYFPELAMKRGGWTGLMAWMLLITITLSFPVVITNGLQRLGF